MSDITLHIDENITGEWRQNVLNKIRTHEGVNSVRSSDSQTHLVVVNYDSKVVSSQELLELLTEEGLHGELVGL